MFSSLDPDVKCVIVGYDAHITYVKMTKAASYLQREGSVFLVGLNLCRITVQLAEGQLSRFSFLLCIGYIEPICFEINFSSLSI